LSGSCSSDRRPHPCVSPRSPASISRPVRSTLAPLLLILAATLAVYARTFTAGFVWNDVDYVTHPSLRSLHGLWRIWFDVGSTDQHYPILHGWFWLQCQLWGEAPAGYHIVNVLLHAGSACLFALVLRQIALPGAWLAGLLFAVHPVCVESVAWISEQKNTLSTFLYLAAALAYLKFDDTRRLSTQRLGFVLFILALLAKPMTASLPAALLVVFWWKRGTLRWRHDVVPLLPWFVLGATVGLFNAWVEHNILGASGEEFQLTFLERVLIAGRAVWFYLGKAFWPVNLVFIYPRWTPDPGSLAQWAWPFTLVLFGFALWLLRRRTRGPLAAFLFFAGSLFPVIGFFNLYAFRYSFVADHWQYLPLLGAIAFLATNLALLAARFAARPQWITPCAASLLVGVLAFHSWRETAGYRDMVTFYHTIIARNPDCWMARLNLGHVYSEAGLLDDAAREFAASIQLWPHLASTHVAYGQTLLALGRVEESIAPLREAVRLSPEEAFLHNNLGAALLRAGDVAGALHHIQRSFQLQPNYAEAHSNFGHLLTLHGEPAAALFHLRKATRLDPNLADAHANLANALFALDQVDDAIASYRTALRLKPNFDVAETNLGNALLHAQHPADALECYRRVLRRNPDSLDARFNLASALVAIGRPAEAIPHYETILRERPQFPEALHNLGVALAQTGRLHDALAHLEAALSLRPDYPDALANLELVRESLAR